MRTAHIKNLPNIVTLTRAILALAGLGLAWNLQWQLAGLVFLVAIITDAVDGELARALKAESQLGEVLDPACDTILSFAMIGGMLLTGQLTIMTALGLLIAFMPIVVILAVAKEGPFKVWVNNLNRVYYALVLVYFLVRYVELGWGRAGIMAMGYASLPLLLVFLYTKRARLANMISGKA